MTALTIVSGVNAGRSYELGNHELVIGRDAICDITLPMRTVSRRHARIGSDSKGYYVEDLQSVNGTFVNGRKLDRRTLLRHHDRIRIGQNVFLYLDPQRDEETVMVDAGHQRRDAPSDSQLRRDNEAADAQMPPIRSTVPASGEMSDSGELHPLYKLRAVLEITRSLGSSLDIQEVVPRILDSLFRIFPQAEHGYILQAPRPGAELEPIAIKHRDENSDTISPLGGPIVARVMTEGTAFLSGSLGEDDSVLDDKSRSVMCAPLMGPLHTPLGVIHLDTEDATRPFDSNDLEVLVAVATVAGQAVEYTRMHTDMLELDRQKRDLSTAKEVQLHFLPQHRPKVPGYQFFDYYRAAATVAGDYYDYIELPDGRLAIVQGDVSGKGVPAALLMARLCSDVRYSLLSMPTPAESVAYLNRQIASHLNSGSFITLVLSVLDPRAHTLTVVNAGHMPPLYRSGSDLEVRAIAKDDDAEMPLGLNPDTVYPQVTMPLAPGDLLLIYTDGVNEAISTKGELYGNQRVRKHFAQAPSDVTHAVQSLVADVRRFAGGQPQSDDICLVCVSRVDQRQ